MSSLAKPTLDNKAQLADAFAKGSTTKAIEQDCTVTDIIAKLLEQEVK